MFLTLNETFFQDWVSIQIDIFSFLNSDIKNVLGKIPASVTISTWKISVFGVFLVRIIPHSDWIWIDTEYLSVFSLNAGK